MKQISILIVGFAVASAVAPVLAEDFTAGKTPAQLFRSDCEACHHSPNGLVKQRTEIDKLTSFLSEHYTTKSETAAALAVYVSGFSPSRGAGRAHTRNRSEGDAPVTPVDVPAATPESAAPESATTESVTTESAAPESAEPATAEHKSAERKSTERKSTGIKSTGIKSTGIKSAKRQPAESKSADSNPADSKPTDASPVRRRHTGSKGDSDKRRARDDGDMPRPPREIPMPTPRSTVDSKSTAATAAEPTAPAGEPHADDDATARLRSYLSSGLDSEDAGAQANKPGVPKIRKRRTGTDDAQGAQKDAPAADQAGERAAADAPPAARQPSPPESAPPAEAAPAQAAPTDTVPTEAAPAEAVPGQAAPAETAPAAPPQGGPQ